MHRLRLSEILLAAVAAIAPFGFSMPIAIGVAFWFVAWCISVHLVISGWQKLNGFDAADKAVGAVLITYIVWAALFVPIRFQYDRQRAEQSEGCLSVERPLLSELFLRPQPYKAIPLRLFGTTGGFVWGGPRGTPIFNWGNGDSYLIIDRDNYGDPLVSTVVRDRDGNVVMQMINNCWQVSGRPIVWDKNYTNNTLEVLGNDGNIIFRIHITHDGVWLDAIWYVLDPRDKTRRTRYPDIVSGFALSSTEPRAFLYPSELYWGKYNPRAHFTGP
jgi:hypothetical protein